MAGKLDGKKIAIVVTDGFEQVEHAAREAENDGHDAHGHRLPEIHRREDAEVIRQHRRDAHSAAEICMRRAAVRPSRGRSLIG